MELGQEKLFCEVIMSYKSDLKKAHTREEIQSIYDKEIGAIAKVSITNAIAEDYEIWMLAQHRFLELFPELSYSFDPDDRIQSKY